MSASVEPFVYNAILERVVDGDTIDVTLDLGFNVFLKKTTLQVGRNRHS